jgi:hypothetical protein
MTKELDRIKLSSSAQLGSLEDHTPVKRVTKEQIKKLRVQGNSQQTQITTSIVRLAVRLYNEISAQLRIIFITANRKYTNCQLNGHSICRTGEVPTCRYCGIVIHSIEELRTP